MISVHSVAEEIVLYPAFEARLLRGQDVANHSRDEHLQIKKFLYELDHMSVDDVKFEGTLKRVTYVIESI